jgi:RNA polymerase sigma factor (sigma-70 family)
MMPKAVSSPILQLIRRVVDDQSVRQLSDHHLLEQFRDQQDETAFGTLLRRHGPMVLDVCRSVLGNEADAEDAFQATFLILARKAPSIRKTASAGSWLHGVAYRTALKARVQSATRQMNEARAPARQVSEPDDMTWREVRQVLHQELRGLAERYSVPLVLCYLEGKTQDEAAAQLGLATSTLKQRLERGRSLLRARLVRRGPGAGGSPARHGVAVCRLLGVPLRDVGDEYDQSCAPVCGGKNGDRGRFGQGSDISGRSDESHVPNPDENGTRRDRDGTRTGKRGRPDDWRIGKCC